MLNLSFNGNFESVNCKIDSGCVPDLVLTRAIADKLGITTPLRKGVPTVSGIEEFEYSEDPVRISFQTERGSEHCYVATKVFIAAYPLLGRKAMTALGVALPAAASEGVIYIFNFGDDEF